MAGKIIVDTIDTDNAFITLNVQQSLIATMNVSGIFSNTGVKMIGANGSVSNTAITGLVTASQIANVANTQITGLIQAAQIGSANASLVTSGTLPAARLPTGSVLQVVSANLASFFSTTSTIPLDDTIPQITEGAEILTCAITPTSATSKLYITVVFNTSASTAALSTIALFQDSTVNALVSSWGTTSSGNSPPPAMTINYSMTSGTTSPTTFRVRGGMNSAGTFQINGASGARYLGGSLISSITITEIAA